VTCSNCHAGGSATLTYVAVIAAVVAALAAVATAVFEGVQQRVFLNQLRAHANFSLTLSLVPGSFQPPPAGSDSLAFSAPREANQALVQVGITNSGSRAASETTINLLVPATVQAAYPCDGGGNRAVDRGRSPLLPTDETLLSEAGAPLPARWVSTTCPRVSTRTPVLVFFFVQVPASSGHVPIRVKVQCDELAEDVAEVTQEGALTVYDTTEPYTRRP